MKVWGGDVVCSSIRFEDAKCPAGSVKVVWDSTIHIHAFLTSHVPRSHSPPPPPPTGPLEVPVAVVSAANSASRHSRRRNTESSSSLAAHRMERVGRMEP